MTVLGLGRNLDAFVAICTLSISKKALKDHARIVSVKLLCLFQEDPKSLASGGYREEKAST